MPSRGVRRLANLYTAGALSDSSVRAMGGRLAGQYPLERADLLARGLTVGSISPSSLGPSDTRLLALADPNIFRRASASRPELKTQLAGLGPQSGEVNKKPFQFLGRFLSNLFGRKGLAGAAYGLPMGVYQTGKSIFKDVAAEPASLSGLITGPLSPIAVPAIAAGLRGGKSELYKNVLKPTGQSYSETYGPLTSRPNIGRLIGGVGVGALTGDPGSKKFLKGFYNRPLGPTLDVISVATLGLGAPARAGGALSRMGFSGGITKGLQGFRGERPPLVISGGLKDTFQGYPHGTMLPADVENLAQMPDAKIAGKILKEYDGDPGNLTTLWLEDSQGVRKTLDLGSAPTQGQINWTRKSLYEQTQNRFNDINLPNRVIVFREADPGSEGIADYYLLNPKEAEGLQAFSVDREAILYDEGILGGRHGKVFIKNADTEATTIPQGMKPQPVVIPREYSQSPIYAVGQDIADAAARSSVRLPGMRSLKEIAEDRARKRLGPAYSRFEQLTTGNINREVSKLRVLSKLDHNEATAMVLLKSGVTPDDLATMERYHRDALLQRHPTHEANIGVEGGQDVTMAEAAASKLPKAMVQEINNLMGMDLRTFRPAAVDEFMKNPTEKMREAGRAWDEQVDIGRQKLAERGPDNAVPDSLHLERSYMVQSMLRGGVKPEELARQWEQFVAENPQYEGLGPNYIPHKPASGIDYKVQGEDVIPSKRQTRVRRPNAILDYPIKQATFNFLEDNDTIQFQSGIFRTDAKVLTDHIAEREQALALEIFNKDKIRQFALKDQDGDPIKVKTETEAARIADPERWRWVPLEQFVRWFQGEVDMAKIFRDRVAEMNLPEDWIADPARVAQVTEDINQLMDANGRLFTQTFLGATKQEGYIMPRAVVDRMQELIKQHDSPEFMNNTVGQGFLKFYNAWRNFTLAYMPRWWLNTLGGTMMLNFLKGTWDPRLYIQARRMAGKGLLPDHVIYSGGWVAAEPIGMTGASRIGLTRAAYKRVQDIENFFRGASYLQSLRKFERRDRRAQDPGEYELTREAKDAFKNVGEVIAGREKSFLIARMKGINEDAYFERILGDPAKGIPGNERVLNQAIDEVNRFSYNYEVLTPMERKYVRLLIPFWGWYKFASKLVWNLPAYHPLRAVAMYNVAQMGEDMLNEYGAIPPWLQGAILWNKGDGGGGIGYLSTKGINPFASFMNPFEPAQTLAGLGQFGQLNPVAQGIMAGAGLDPYTGAATDSSPETNIGQDFMGRWIDISTGREVSSPGEKGRGERLAGAVMRSFPYVRIGERMFAANGKAVYPESIPFLATKPRPTKQQSVRDFSGQQMLEELSGVRPGDYDLGAYQRILPKSVKYVQTRNERQRKKLKKQK